MPIQLLCMCLNDFELQRASRDSYMFLLHCQPKVQTIFTALGSNFCTWSSMSASLSPFRCSNAAYWDLQIVVAANVALLSLQCHPPFSAEPRHEAWESGVYFGKTLEALSLHPLSNTAAVMKEYVSVLSLRHYYLDTVCGCVDWLGGRNIKLSRDCLCDSWMVCLTVHHTKMKHCFSV